MVARMVSPSFDVLSVVVGLTDLGFSGAVPPRASATDTCYCKARGAEAPGQRTGIASAANQS